jgi:O-antigen/teichoic acid export membrane protein
MGLLISDMKASAPSLVLAWGGAAGVCVIVALIQLRAIPNPLAAVSWLREHRDLVPYFLGEYMLTTGAFNGGYLTVGAIIGDQAVGSIRAAQVLLGPLQIVAGAGMSFGLPELSRRAGILSNRSRRKIAIATSVGMALLSTVYTALLYLVPDEWGTLLFAGKWVEAQEVLLPLSLAMILSTAALGPAMVIYALGLASRTFRIMTIEAPLVFVLMIAGTLLTGVVGAAWGQFADQSIVLLLWYGTLLSILAARSREERAAAREGSAERQPSAEGEPGPLHGDRPDRGVPAEELPRR